MDATALIADLLAAFPRERVPAETAQLYLRALDDVDTDLLAEVVRDLIFTTDRFPTVAALRRGCAERMLALPSEPEALAQAEAHAQRGRGSRGEAPYAHALVKEALSLVGGPYALRTAENPSMFRSQFLRLYRDCRESAIRDVQTGQARGLPSPRPAGSVSCP